MGIVLHGALGLMPTIGALIGIETVIAGWAVHLFNSAAFGTLFVAIFDRAFFDDLRTDVGGYLSLGVIHSALLGMITGGLLLPVALAIEGATSLPVPTLPVPGLTRPSSSARSSPSHTCCTGSYSGGSSPRSRSSTPRSDGCRSTRSTGSGRGDTRPNLRSLTQRPCPRDERRV